MLSSDFHSKENDGFRVVSAHPGLVTRDHGVNEVGVTVYGVLGLWVRPRTRHFPYYENPTRALNTTSLILFIN